MKKCCKKMTDSETVQTYLVRQEYLNGSGRILAEPLMGWVCETADLTAMRHSGAEVTVTSVDNQMFFAPMENSRIIVTHGKVIHTGETLMDVQVDVYAEDQCGKRRMISRTYVTMAAIDEKMHPMPVPGIEKTDLKKAVGE